MRQTWMRIGRGAVAALLAAAIPFGRPSGRALAQNNQHCGDVSRNETWGSQDAHFVNCTVTVRNSKLTIAQGAQLFMAQGASIVVAAGSTLEIAGNFDANEPVRILPNDRDVSPGFWGQIRYQSGSVDNFIRFAFIQGGGQGGVPMIEADAPVRVLRADLQKSAGPPMAFLANIAGPSLDEAGQSVTGRCGLVNLNPGSNGRDGILIKAEDEADIVDGQTWHDFCVPYLVEQDLAIGGPDGPTLTLTDGVVMRFGRGAGIIAGTDAESPGQFEVTGSTERSVTLSGIEERPGSWDGVTFSPFVDPAGVSNSLYFARVEYGGSVDKAMVRVHCPTLPTLDSVFAHAPGYPVEIVPSAVSDLTEGLASTSANAFVDNAVQRIKVLAAAADPDILENSNWKHPGVPLELDGDLSWRGAGRDVSLNLEHGLRLLFPVGAGMHVGAGGGLRVDASRSSPVRLEGLEARPGSWSGLRLADGVKGVEINGLDMGFGGSATEAMLEWGNAQGSLLSSTLHDAVGYPAAVAAPRLEALAGEDQEDPGLRNRYQGNGIQRLLVRTRLPLEQRLVTLVDPGLPLEADGSLTIASSVNTVVKMGGGLDLRFRQDQGLLLSGTDLRADLTFAPGRSGLPVHMGPLDLEGGQTWKGLRALKGAAINGGGLVLEGEVAGGGDAGALLDLDEGVAELNDLVLRGAGAGIGLRVSSGARMTLTGAHVSGFATGILNEATGFLSVERSVIAGNRDWGLLSLRSDSCVLALRVYWGKPKGPEDMSAAQDGCVDAAYAGGGDKVSDHVQWWPYAVDERYTPAQGLGPGMRSLYLPLLRGGSTP